MAGNVDDITIRRLLRHEAQVHALPGRVLRDLGDGLLLHDPVEAEPFWNRLKSVRWPVDATAFDQRLAEIRILFASIGRQPHVWLTPPHDTPSDLFDRLRTNGFEDMGRGLLMVARDADRARAVLDRESAAIESGLTIERFRVVDDRVAATTAEAIVGVLVDAFGVDPQRRPGIVVETITSLRDPRFTHYLVREDGEPAAVARRATFDGLSYLSSIGTTTAARGRGLGRLVTATATVDAIDAGSEMVHLGVFVDNQPAVALYEGLGYVMGCEPGPDMFLVG